MSHFSETWSKGVGKIGLNPQGADILFGGGFWLAVCDERSPAKKAHLIAAQTKNPAFERGFLETESRDAEASSSG
jgi:hypothetical protein